jgi:hypothetical protein
MKIDPRPMKEGSMSHIVLTEEQAQFLRGARGRVEVRDTQGRLLGHMIPELTPEEIAVLKNRGRSSGPWYSGEEVQQRLQALQEAWDREGGFDEARMHELLAQLRAARRA